MNFRGLDALEKWERLEGYSGHMVNSGSQKFIHNIGGRRMNFESNVEAK